MNDCDDDVDDSNPMQPTRERELALDRSTFAPTGLTELISAAISHGMILDMVSLCP